MAAPVGAPLAAGAPQDAGRSRFSAAGDKDFTVHFDCKAIQPDGIVTALKAGGEKGAKVKS